MFEHLHKADCEIQTIPYNLCNHLLDGYILYFLPSQIHIGCMCAVTITGCTYLGCTMLGGVIRMF